MIPPVQLPPTIITPFLHDGEKDEKKLLLKADRSDLAPKEVMDLKVRAWQSDVEGSIWGGAMAVFGGLSVFAAGTVIFSPALIVTIPAFIISSAIHYIHRKNTYVAIHLKEDKQWSGWDAVKNFFGNPPGVVYVRKKDFENAITELNGEPEKMREYRYLKNGSLGSLVSKKIDVLPVFDKEKQKLSQASRVGQEFKEAFSYESRIFKNGQEAYEYILNGGNSKEIFYAPKGRYSVIGFLAKDLRNADISNSEKEEIIQKIHHLHDHYKVQETDVFDEKVPLKDSPDLFGHIFWDFDLRTNQLISDGKIYVLSGMNRYREYKED